MKRIERSRKRVAAIEAITETVGRLEVMLREQRTDSQRVEAEVKMKKGAMSDCSVVRNTESLAHLSWP